MKKIAIILVNYKDYAEKFLAECRDSLRAQNYNKNLFQAYIVDNASTEKSRNYLSQNYPESIIIPREDGNYSAANNAGIKKAIEDGCEYFVIANMDAVFDENWLRELVNALENNLKAGIAQSKILIYNKESEIKKINSIGNIFHFLGFGMSQGEGQDDYEIQGYPDILGYASGCSFIIKKEVINKIGYYNEEYYMYHDDIEISLRAKLAGYKIVLAPRSIVYHKYEFGRTAFAFSNMERNRYLVLFSFYKIPTLILILPPLIAMDLGILFFSFLNGWLSSKLKVYKYFLEPKNWQKIIKTRVEIQKNRIIQDQDLIKNFSGKILFQEIENPVLKYIVNPAFNFYWQIVKSFISW